MQSPLKRKILKVRLLPPEPRPPRLIENQPALTRQTKGASPLGDTFEVRAQGGPLDLGSRHQDGFDSLRLDKIEPRCTLYRMINSEVRQKARRMRSGGMSLKDISRKIDVAKSTLSLWLRDMPLNAEQLDRYKEKAKANVKVSQVRSGGHCSHLAALLRLDQWKREAEEFWITHKDEGLFNMGLGLYWGEGAKTSKTLSIANSDPSAIKTWLKWCRKYLPPGTDLHVRVIVRDDNDVEKVKLYWENITKLRVKVNTVPSKNEPTRKNFTGTASVQVGKGSAEWFTKVMYCIHKYK